jgi:hypothetical protein
MIFNAGKIIKKMAIVNRLKKLYFTTKHFALQNDLLNYKKRKLLTP